ncbi:helix-turn-helix transcriptional regulator [Celeribacter sp.]|uniref:helix-turn-helix transcriptional regulator n=1 Tax=Celeribacter sp. TaxID=1890673 RepID=UPI003A8D9CB3
MPNDTTHSHCTDPLLTAKEGAKLLSVSQPTFWRKVSEGTFPKPIKLGHSSRWPQSELLEVIEAAKSKRHETSDKN